MRACLDDLVVALYVTIDELLGPDPRSGRPGRKPRLSDSELVCLAVAQVLLGCHGEHRWLRFCYGRLGHLFPYLPNQPGYNKRLRAARWLLGQVLAYLAGQTPGVHDTLRLLDATPVPCAASRTTVKRSALGGIADYGWCPSHSRWYWGFKLYLLTTPDGSPVAWCLASPKLGEREVATALLDRGSLQPGQVVIVDKGLAGAEVDRHLANLEAVLVRPDRRDEPAGTAACGRCASGSRASSTPSRASSGWSSTAAAPRPGSIPGSASACWPWPPPSGSTPSSAPRTSARCSPTTTESMTTQSESIFSTGPEPTLAQCPDLPGDDTDGARPRHYRGGRSDKPWRTDCCRFAARGRGFAGG